MNTLKYRVIISLFVLFLLAGCATKPSPQATTTVCETLIMKCQVPDVPKAEIETIPSDASYDVKLQIILNNCLKIQRENELLRKALEICK